MVVRVLASRTLMSGRELLNLTESLAALLSAGLTIDRALQVCGALMSSSAARASVESLLTAVRSGKTLQGAFAARPERLPPYFLSMVEAGEVGGSLAETLKQLAQLMHRQFEVRERVRSALFYPAILAGMVLTTLILLLTFVLPRFQLMFAEADTPIPTATRLALATESVSRAMDGSSRSSGPRPWQASSHGCALQKDGSVSIGGRSPLA